jgi:hypothetical protein
METHMKLMREALKKWKQMRKYDYEWNESEPGSKRDRELAKKFKRAATAYHHFLNKLDAWEYKHRIGNNGEQYNRRHGGEYWRYHPEVGNWSAW